MPDYDEHRRRMIAETSAFIEWGLAHPDQVRWIPRKPIGTGGFTRRMQVVFWYGVFATAQTASRQLLGRLRRWVHLG